MTAFHTDGTRCAGESCAWRGDGGHEPRILLSQRLAVDNALDTLINLAEALSHLTCIEAEALADLYFAFGRVEEGQSIITGHAYGDDDADDMHHRLYLELHDEACPTAGCLITGDHNDTEHYFREPEET